jgi:hypothetical protein
MSCLLPWCLPSPSSSITSTVRKKVHLDSAAAERQTVFLPEGMEIIK